MSKVVKILSIKTTNVSRNIFINYNYELSKTVKVQKGFISLESFWKNNIYKFDNEIYQIVSISEWKNFNSWNEWYNSLERKHISDKFNKLDCKEEFNIIHDKNNINDIFLL